MDGPDILVRTLSQRTIPDQFGNFWQYHSRSNRHANVAYWALMFDLLQQSRLLGPHVEAGKVALGVNHKASDPRTGQSKKLDLVIGRRADRALTPPAASMSDLALRWGVRLSSEQRSTLADLPDLREGVVDDVLVALKAKACMTEHIKALPRLFDELTSAYSTVQAVAPEALAVGYALVNASDSFLSTDMNKYDLSERHATVNQQRDHAAGRVTAKLVELDRQTGPAGNGFDVFGITALSMRNDGSPVTLVLGPPAPDRTDAHSYEAMVTRLAQGYDDTFAAL